MTAIDSSVAEATLNELVAQMVSFPAARCCKHWAAACVLSAMQSMGLPVTKELADAVVNAEDDVALALLNKGAASKRSPGEDGGAIG